MMELTTGSAQKFSAYRADPEGAPKGAVIVLHDVHGLDSRIRQFTDGFAEKGYVAVAPSLFDPLRPNAEFGRDPDGETEGRSLKAQLDGDWPIAAIQATVDAMKPSGKVAVVGYSWGGTLAYLAANKVSGLACAVGYTAEDILDGAREKRRIPTLLHFAEKDQLMPDEAIIQFRAQRPDVSTFLYPDARHNFPVPESGDYDDAAAVTALERTLFWISQYVEGQGPVMLKNAGSYAQAKSDKKGKKKSGADDMGPPLD